MLVTDELLTLFPLHTEGWIAKHIVEGLTFQVVFRKAVAEVNVLVTVPLNHRVGLADGLGLLI